MAVLATVKPKLIRNRIKSLFTPPKTSLEIIVDKTKVQANEKMKTAVFVLLISIDARKGLNKLSEAVIEERAVWVKIW